MSFGWAITKSWCFIKVEVISRARAPRPALWSPWGGWTPSESPRLLLPTLPLHLWRFTLQTRRLLGASKHRSPHPGDTAQITQRETTTLSGWEKRRARWDQCDLPSSRHLVVGYQTTRILGEMEQETLYSDTHQGDHGTHRRTHWVWRRSSLMIHLLSVFIFIHSDFVIFKVYRQYFIYFDCINYSMKQKTSSGLLSPIHLC